MSQINRKFRKLLRDPQLFFKDMYFKHSTRAKKFLPIKYTGNYDYTIVTAIYNVEKYLDDFFNSITKQSLSFKKHIQIICVDDGSTDNSAKIINNWQRKFPNNIQYIYKENGGQSSARNLGLEYTTTEWVTFIDPDDFLNTDYFKIVDTEIANNPNSQMVVSNLIFFIEANNSYKDTHSLKYRFNKKVNKVEVTNLENNINLSVASSFFRTQYIKQFNLLFDHKVKPNFEDGKFIADYLLNQTYGFALFLKDAHYFYRKRGDQSSTLNKAWQSTGKFFDVLKYGYIPMLEDFKNKQGHVPTYIQRTVLYDAAWYIDYLLNQDGRTSFLTEEQKEVFHLLWKDIFTYIDTKTILDFNLAGTWFLYRVIFLEYFKQQEMPYQFAYIENIDQDQQLFLLSFYSYKKPYEQILLDTQSIAPVSAKTVTYTITGKPVAYERRLWISYKEATNNQKFHLLLGNKPVKISILGSRHNNGVSADTIISSFSPSGKYQTGRSDIWIIMDRDIQADDNGEHFYRYVQQYHPEQQIFFALNKDSHDWNRLSKDGFNLLEFGSSGFEAKLKIASKLISSHADEYFDNYFKDHYEYSKKYIFLQHGVTQNNISCWLNRKKNIKCMVTATIPEYHSIADDLSPYKLSNKEVVLTGFPRHDKLLAGNQTNTRTILIMPTWRSSIVGEATGQGNVRKLNKNFMNTTYAKHWCQFLNSRALKEIAEKYNYQLVFAPHANIEPYLTLMNIPNYIQIWKAANGNIQSLFQTSTFMITDYSSVAFEMAFLGKTVLYYQFDKEEVFSGGHITQSGYFKYDQHGFGPVSETEDQLCNNILKVLENEGRPCEPYLSRIEKTFAFRDQNNCKRVYNAIKALDIPKQHTKTEIVEQYINSSVQHQAWNSVLDLCNSLASDNYENPAFLEETQFLALFKTGKFIELKELLELSKHALKTTISYWQAKLYTVQSEWENAIKTFSSMPLRNNFTILLLIECHARLHNMTAIKQLIEEYDQNVSEQCLIMSNAWVLYSEKKWQELCDFLTKMLPCFNTKDLIEYKPQLLLAYAQLRADCLSEAHQTLLNYEEHTTDDWECRLIIAHLAFMKESYKTTIKQLEQGFKKQYEYIPATTLPILLESLEKTDNHKELKQVLSIACQRIPNHFSVLRTNIKLWEKEKNWLKILHATQSVHETDSIEIIYPAILARYRLGLLEEAYNTAPKPNNRHHYQYWALITELSMLLKDYTVTEYCYQHMIALFPDIQSEENWRKLHDLRERQASYTYLLNHTKQ
ncbi:CDP-glycerol glycerophosphotransferase family protein [Neisseria wadsworthii]|uniref:Family 2 glycosyl transferase n=1 Tax=Neisseria wadsworthii 9715 TaxID=1030841 RepID=G4CM15_9NEIS|nr:CDP-glycerol glycerophosphotransferase family protein [Neisseria wadsworthii]EGZ51262.1 family 2 glycosyl transferase [Neisseria wadsworthii 9715]QMT36187.1 CDP-glycerol glycerophosphotransferase family protein [Neisseria wadsworthii]